MQTESVTEEEFATIRNVDRLIPSQEWVKKLYTGDDFHQSLETVLLSMLPHQTVTEKFKLTMKEGVTYASLGSDINTLSFIQMLILMNGYKTVLELGTYIGVSTLFLAEAVGNDGSVVTVERGQEFCDIAAKNFQDNPNRGQIFQVNDDAVRAMITYGRDLRKFDCIFIDAAKESYTHLLALALTCITDNGMILVDDVFFQGDTLNEKQSTKKGAGVKNMLDYAALLHGWRKVILPIGNGLLIMRKE